MPQHIKARKHCLHTYVINHTTKFCLLLYRDTKNIKITCKEDKLTYYTLVSQAGTHK